MAGANLFKKSYKENIVKRTRKHTFAGILSLLCCNIARKIERLTGKDFPNIRPEIRQNPRHG